MMQLPPKIFCANYKGNEKECQIARGEKNLPAKIAHIRAVQSQTTLAIPNHPTKTPINNFKRSNDYVYQEYQQAQYPRSQGRYEQVQDGSRERGRCIQNLLNFYTDEY